MSLSQNFCKVSRMSGRDDNGEQVILATAGYDHSIRFWQAHNGVCHRTVPHTESISFLIRVFNA